MTFLQGEKMHYITIVGIIIGVICVAIKLISDHREWKKYEEEFRQKKINEEKSRLRGNMSNCL